MFSIVGSWAKTGEKKIYSIKVTKLIIIKKRVIEIITKSKGSMWDNQGFINFLWLINVVITSEYEDFLSQLKWSIQVVYDDVGGGTSVTLQAD